jgi:putative DNA primase/helicase
MTDRLNIRDKFDRVLQLLEDQADSFVEYVKGKPDETTRHHHKWRQESGLFYYRTGRYAGKFHCYGTGAHGDLIDFYATYALNNPKAKGDALRDCMAWLGLSDDAPLPDEKAAAKRRRERQERLEREAAKKANRDAQKRDEATRRIQGGLFPVGTPLEHYITTVRNIPVTSWPPCVVFDQKEHAAAFAVTDDAGTIHALQHVALTPDGCQDKRYPGDKPRAKNDLGPKSKGVVRFPGERDDYLILGEGPETTWTGNVAYDCEGWACLGGMYHAVNFNIGARTVLVLRDDDAETSGGYRSAVKAVKDLRAAGHEVIEVWPFEQHRGNGDDFNTLAQESGIEAVRARIEQAVSRHSHARFELSLEKTKERLDGIATQFFSAAELWDKEGEEAPTTYAAGFTVGAGKTEGVLHHGSDFLINARLRQNSVAGIHAVPEHKLSDEVAVRFNRMAAEKGYDLSAKVWRGREAMRPDGSGEKMCANIDEVKDAQAVFVDDIEKEVCERCPHHPNNGGACAYLAQRSLDADYWVVSHNMLFAEVPTAINKRGVGFVVVDESIWQAGLIGTEGKGIKIAVDSLLPSAGIIVPRGPDGERLRAIREDLAKVLLDEPDDWVSREAIERANIQDDTAAFARKQEWLRKVDRKQEPNWRLRDDNKTLGRLTALWSAVDNIVKSPDIAVSGRLRLTTEEGVRTLYVYGRDDIAAGWRAPTIAIDALHRPDLLAHYFPNIEDRGYIPTAAPHMIVEQAVYENWAKSYLDPTMGDGDDKQKRDKRRRAKALSLKMAARIGGKILLIGAKNVVQAIKATGLPPNICIGWHNATAGRDEFVFPDGETIKGADLEGVILLGGGPEPTSNQVERMAGALTGIAPKPVGTPDGRYPKADAERLMRKGRSIVAIPAEGKRHPDDLCETIRQHITLGQLIQAAGRGRGIRRRADKPLRVIALTGAVLPFPVDTFLTEADVAITHADLMLAEGAVSYEDGTSAATAYPDLYPSPGAAREAFRLERNNQRGPSGSLIGISIRDTDAPLPVTFQKAGLGQRPQRAWVLPSCPDPRAAIEAALGPLARFEVVGREPAGEPIRVAVGGAGHSPISVAPAPIVVTPVSAPVPELPPQIDAIEPPIEAEADAPDVNWPAVRERLRDTGISHGDLAVRVGVSQPHLSNMERGFRRPTAAVAAALEAFLRETPPTQERLL